MANSHNCSPYTERYAPLWLLSAITTTPSLRITAAPSGGQLQLQQDSPYSLQSTAPPSGQQPQLQPLHCAQRPLVATICNYNTIQALQITAAPAGGQRQLQGDPPTAYRVQRLLVANSHNCSPHTEHNAP